MSFILLSVSSRLDYGLLLGEWRKNTQSRVKMEKKTILKRSWVWNKTVTEFVKTKISGYSLNVCAGLNPICDVNLDLDPKDRTIIKGEMKLLPFPSNTFDTVISDPPWKIGYYNRFKPFFECVRVCKVGGMIIYNAYWIPGSPQGDVKLKELWVRQDNEFTNTSVISLFEKIKDNPTYNSRQEELLTMANLTTAQLKQIRQAAPIFHNVEKGKPITYTQSKVMKQHGFIKPKYKVTRTLDTKRKIRLSDGWKLTEKGKKFNKVLKGMKF